jgi:ribosome-binding factor A
MVKEVKRAARVGERVKEELSWLLARNVRDPRLAGVTVSEVRMSDDLRNARVYVVLLEGGSDAERRKEALAALTGAAGMLRGEVTQRVGLRFAPSLRFLYDDTREKRARIDQLLAEVEADRQKGR